eukprot:gene22544-29670_t
MTSDTTDAGAHSPATDAGHNVSGKGISGANSAGGGEGAVAGGEGDVHSDGEELYPDRYNSMEKTAYFGNQLVALQLGDSMGYYMIHTIAACTHL